MNQENSSASESKIQNTNSLIYIIHNCNLKDLQNMFSKFTHIHTKKEYIDKRIKLENSYVIFFAYSTNSTEENDNLSINQEWLDVFESIQEEQNYSKYLELVMVF